MKFVDDRGPSNPNQLIVEGYDDLRFVAGLMRAHIEWDENRDHAPVWINPAGVVEKVLGYVKQILKMPGLRALGVMLDADTKPQGRYDSIRNLCVDTFPGLPKATSPGGLIQENRDQRFGVWIMPDNASEGSIETFLCSTVPVERKRLWSHAIESVSAARNMNTGATCRDCHVDKANLYTWLAWQDPPGQSGGDALKRKALNPLSESALPFVKWFKDLYRL